MSAPSPSRVLLLNPPYPVPVMRDTLHPTAKSALYVWHPLDLLVQSAYVADCDVRIFDGVVQPSVAALERVVADFAPQHVLSLVSSPTLASDMALLTRLKEQHRFRLFVVGDVTYGRRERFLHEAEGVDGVLWDFASPGFADSVFGRTPRDAAWREGGEIRVDVERSAFIMDRPRQDLIDFSQYYLPYWRPPFASVYTAHGCVSICTFCPVPEIGKPHYRDLDAVLAEIDYLYRRGIRKVFFRDASFGQSPRRVQSLCESLARRFPGLRFSAWMRPNPLSEATADALRDAGAEYMHIGVETGSEAHLARLRKQFTLGDVDQAVAMFAARGVKTIGHFLLGAPGESDRDYRDTLGYLRRARLSVVSVSVFEESMGVPLRYGDGVAPTESLLRRRVLAMLASFLLRPDRWLGFFRFIEGPRHFVETLARFTQYLFSLRLYPRIEALR